MMRRSKVPPTSSPRISLRKSSVTRGLMGRHKMLFTRIRVGSYWCNDCKENIIVGDCSWLPFPNLGNVCQFVEI